ncbi:MAG: Nickel transport protein NikQ [Syntrophaceae bacterium PtaU1.Bin231]|nr:MAG: Nickel transport protein NikQ [Syntrophaceae bacterium PtaU1.Bin231]
MNHAYIDEYSRIDSFINRLDPRIKIVSLLAFVLFVISSKPDAVLGYALYGMLAALLVALSGIPLRFFLKRLFTVLPFVLLAALSIPFMGAGNAPGVLSGPFQAVGSHEGWILFRTVVIKAVLSLLCITLFITGTPFPELLQGLERMKIPRLITMILSFMYRYIFLIQDEAMRMWRAKKSRSAGASAWLDLKATANLIGVLFIRSFERAETVYLSMCSRGFDGTIRSAERLRLKRRDLVFLCAMLICLIQIRIAGNG